MSHGHVIDIFKEPRRLEELQPRLLLWGLGVGIFGFVVALLVPWLMGEGEGTERRIFWFSYLIGFAYILAIALGGLFFVLVHHAIGAGWGIVLRRISEGVAMTIPVIGLLAIPIITYEWGFKDIYAEWESESPLLEHKAGYMRQRSLIFQIVLCFVIWSAMAWWLFSSSVRQDRTGDLAISKRLRKFSGPLIIVFALTVSVAAFLLLMAVNPEWFSTIFGVYFFAGSTMSFFAFLALIMVWLQANGRLVHAISTEHYHDVGKLCFTFVVFWAYIAFSQYMLIWYANIPEETVWYRPFHKGDEFAWKAFSWLLIIGHFFIPFLFMMSRHIKRRPKLLALGCVWVLAMHWVDLFWVVMPRLHEAWTAGHSAGVEGVPSVGGLAMASFFCTFGFVGILVAAWSLVLRRCSLVPERDPRLAESLLFENF